MKRNRIKVKISNKVKIYNKIKNNKWICHNNNKWIWYNNKWICNNSNKLNNNNKIKI